MASVWDQVSEAVSVASYRPRLRGDLTWARLKSRRGAPYTILADRPRLYLRLGPHDDFLASRMDGSRRVSDLVIEYFRRFGRFGFDRIATLVADLRHAGFLVDPPSDVYQTLKGRLQPEAPPKRGGRWEGTALRLRLPLRGIDPVVGRLHDRLRWIFTRPALALTVAIAVSGLVAFVAEIRAGHDPFAPIANSGVAGLIGLVLAFYVVVFVHETAHAATAKHFGRRVDEGGFMLYYFIPAFYVNVTDAWLEPWYRRVAIFWAGPYSGFVLAGLCSLLVAFVPGPALVMTVLFKIAVAAYINNLVNLMPLLLLDGYWILEEWVETPGLRQKALNFVRGPLWHRLLDRKRLNRREAFYAVFGSLCAVYSFLSIYLAFFWWGRRLRPILRPLWATPGLLAKLVLVVVIAVVAVPLGIRLGRQLWRYQRAIRQAPAAARQALQALRVRDRLRLLQGLGFLRTLPAASMERLAKAAGIRDVAEGGTIVRQGERGDEFFVIAQGEAVVLVREAGDDTMVERKGAGDFFGERALLGSGIRQASVKAVTPMRLLVFEQRAFWNELGGVVAWESQVRKALQERERLRAVPLFSEATPRQLDLLAVKLVVHGFHHGDTVMRQGDSGDAFYIIREGQVDVLARANGRSRRISVLGPGDYFGEIALLRDQPRTATIRAKSDGSAWRLERQDFRDLLGRYLELDAQLAGIADARVPRGHSVAGAA
ncbi:MAG TPA: cyclic nucleotide-binding domain-containing protein [Candidatus Dormibacteraeota bacterium]|nr:cyclic nucleotide-binding domain-containing protein [Candidatus Dormibacteraeota bacterium]